MSLYLVAGTGASTDPHDADGHLPTGRPRQYPTDTSDREWALVASLIPIGGPVAGHGGRPVTYCRRDILDAIRYLIGNGCVWRTLPVDYPPWRTVFHAWTSGSILSRLHDTLRERIRLTEGRTADPTAAIIDSQSVRAAETVAAHRRGFDAGKKINGRKRHIAVDVTGLLLAVLVTAASVQDRDGATFLITAIRACFRHVTKSGLMPATEAAPPPSPRPSASTWTSSPRTPTRPASPSNPQVDRRANTVLDQPIPAHRPRLRTPTPAPRRHRPMDHDHHHDPQTHPLRT